MQRCREDLSSEIGIRATHVGAIGRAKTSPTKIMGIRTERNHSVNSTIHTGRVATGESRSLANRTLEEEDKILSDISSDYCVNNTHWLVA